MGVKERGKLPIQWSSADGVTHNWRWYKWEQQAEGTFVGKAVQGHALTSPSCRQRAGSVLKGWGKLSWVNRAWMTEACRDEGWRDFRQAFWYLSRLSFGATAK